VSTTAATKGGPLLRIQEVMERLQVSRATLYRMVYDGRIPVVRFGKIVRFRPEAVEALITIAEGGPVKLVDE